MAHKYDVEVDVTDLDGDSRRLITEVRHALIRADVSSEDLHEFGEQAQGSSEWWASLQTVWQWVSVRGLLTARTQKCRPCGAATDLCLDAEAFCRWAFDRVYVQDAFPTWTADERELLISGTHPACWDAMFGPEE